jgi:hypothetical protein
VGRDVGVVVVILIGVVAKEEHNCKDVSNNESNNNDISRIPHMHEQSK